VKAILDKEVSLGQVAGPFSTPPFPNLQVSPIGLVPKKYSDKFCTIFHLSFPKSGVTSINYSFSKKDFSLNYITIDTAIAGILANGCGCFLVDSAFRLIPLRPCDYELFGMQWEGKFYYDKVLPFALRSAPSLFNQLSEGHAHGVGVQSLIIKKFLIFTQIFFGLTMNKTIEVIDSLLYQLVVVLLESPLFCRVSE